MTPQGMVPRRLLLLVSSVAFVGACSGGGPMETPGSSTGSTTSVASVTASPLPDPSPSPAPDVAVRDFPAFPEGPLPEPVSDSLRAVLDDAVEAGSVDGVTAAVIVGDAGHWAGAAGVDPEGDPLTPDSRILTASIGKTVTAAQVLRLAEEGALDLDDLAADHLPPELGGYDANGATIRELLSMRSGIADPSTYFQSVEAGATISELVEMLPEPLFPPGSERSYGNTNYLLLGAIVEHATGRTLWEVLRSDVLDRPGLGGLRYPVRDALAADGWRIESDPDSLARWGYDLYGGSILSAASRRAMTDFGGHVYGLGVLNMTAWNPATEEGFGEPAIGHAGLEPGVATMLVAFPDAGEVVSVLTYGGEFRAIRTLIQDLRGAVR